MQFLKEAAKESIFARAEARYFLGNISLNYEEDYKEATRHLEQLYNTYPHNNYYARILARSYYRMDRFDEALHHIDKSLERWQQKGLNHQSVLKEELLTWKGRIYFRRFQYREAATTLQQAFEAGAELTTPEERSQHVIAGYFLGRSLLQLDNKEEARHYLQAITDMEAQENYRDHAEQLLNEHF
ncbi:MAG: tetratricopeptide repeat protein [Balneolaceae bacterium]|nr:tetratricopeptide repeat protein [Balneolaceae bacterium]